MSRKMNLPGKLKVGDDENEEEERSFFPEEFPSHDIPTP
jgi:hypothetical protein